MEHLKFTVNHVLKHRMFIVHFCQSLIIEKQKSKVIYSTFKNMSNRSHTIFVLQLLTLSDDICNS